MIRNKILSICVLFFLTGCFFRGEEKLTIINNSGSDMFYELNYNSDTLDYYNPFDVQNMTPKEKKYRFNELRIAKFSQKRPRLPFESWTTRVSRSKDSVLRIYFYYPDTIYHIPRETIRDKKMWIKKRSYKIKDLDAIDWKIYFL